MNKTAKTEDSISIPNLMSVLTQHRATAKANRDQISLDSPEPGQRNWQFFNGQIRAIDSIESHLRLYLSTLTEAPAPKEPVKPRAGEIVIPLSNGASLAVTEGDDEIIISHTEGCWWLCTVTVDGVLVSSNSGSGCEELVRGLKRK